MGRSEVALEVEIQRLSIPVSKPHHSKIRHMPKLAQIAGFKRRAALLLLGWLVLSRPFVAFGAGCVATSEPHRVALLELYTSEGCNSCPPADRWLNGLRGRGFTTAQVVPLAFHVDYWDYIGWKDPYAHPQHSQRQQLIAARNRASVVYTPQFVLNGRDIRRPWFGDEFAHQLHQINGQAANIEIKLTQTRDAHDLYVSVRAQNSGEESVRAFVALYQNGLSSDIRAGENVGKKLYHEHVVRALKGPILIADGQRLDKNFYFDLHGYADPSQLGIVVFAEDAASGATLQALSVPVCPGAQRP